ncbi:amine oxidase [Thelephora ganbajun]|uniref:Amine oxidase n=1 Tax=Thelephora ganbajun TaxID=370292 RepID=A0ACB6Z237_THEGA|nr:amine oxidase [Thelephora ganbajun]
MSLHLDFQPLPLLSFGTQILLLLFCGHAFSIPVERPSGGSVQYPLGTGLRDGLDARVLILGAGIAGITAAQKLESYGISDFLIVEAHHEVGGRLKSRPFGSHDHVHASPSASSRDGEIIKSIEVGAQWIQGYHEGNPIWGLAKKHGIKTQLSDFAGSVTTYDETGKVDFIPKIRDALGAYTKLVVGAAGERVLNHRRDMSARTGYSIVGSKPRTPQEMAAEYYAFDFEYAQTPEQTSWIASSWAHNFTFEAASGGFSKKNHLCVDKRGFKRLVQGEAHQLRYHPNDPNRLRIMLNSTVQIVRYDSSEVEVQLESGRVLRAEYVIVTFSLGVLQNDEVVFEPRLPAWKVEAIESMSMGTYTKIYLQFPRKFWFDTQMALYADVERGRYPVWQSFDHPDFFPGSGILFVTVTGDFSHRIEYLTDSQVKSEVMTVLRTKMYPHLSPSEIPDPVDFYFERWWSNPLFRGSYSNWPASFFEEHHEDLVRTIGGRVGFAGEHTSAKHFGFLHGAYFSGVRAANEIRDLLRGRRGS